MKMQYIIHSLRLSIIMAEYPSLKTLAIDTSTPRGSVALLQGQELIGEIRLKSLETHSARLLRSIEFLLESTGWALKELNLVAAGIGPGSFTGIRIGVATALGLAQSLGVSFAGISGLDALASQATFLRGRLAVVMDAQRSQIYYAEYVRSGDTMRRVDGPALLDPFDLEFRLQKRHLHVLADQSLHCLEKLVKSGPGWPRLIRADLFLASTVGKLALLRKRAWRSGDCLAAEPLYIRPPDALRPKLRK
jgi:tRNA threonylcarbamoyladenosine biosynthesis protein TsaB